MVPCNSRILTAFGGGIIHLCDNGTHHAESFLATDGLVGLNTLTLHDLDATARLQAQVGDKLALIFGDYTLSTTARTSMACAVDWTLAELPSSRSIRPSSEPH